MATEKKGIPQKSGPLPAALPSPVLAATEVESGPMRDFFIDFDQRPDGAAGSDQASLFSDLLSSRSRALSGDVREYLYFSLGKEQYGIELGRIKEIVKFTTVTPVPRTKDYVAGIVSLRGTIVPLYKLSKLLNLRTEEEGANRILVVEGEDGELVGLMVQKVHHVVRISGEAIEPPPATIHTEGRQFIFGIGRVDERVMTLLDLDALIEGSKNAGSD
jgi:purine-binding chemotaxis protein CheW